MPDVNLLLVDDLEDNLIALEALLRAPGRQIFKARSGDAALSLMLEHEFALAVLDVQMPAMDGFELAELMRGTERTRAIPIVFVTAAGRELNYSFRGYDAGAVDVLYKPLDPHAVRSKVAAFVELARQRRALQDAQDELRRAVTVRDDFMSMVSHELRNPLNTVYLQAQLRSRLLEGSDPVDREAMMKMVTRDQRQIRSMIRLLDDMLDVARVRNGRLAVVPATFDLAALARRTVEAIGEQARGSGVDVQVQAPSELIVNGDEFRIEQVVSNLLTNALRYGEGTPVAVVVESHPGAATVTVRDHGPGISAEDQQRIFEQFERAGDRSKAPGLGLGLYISRQIAQAHEGSLNVHSVPGEGAAFVLQLPAQH